MEIWPILPETAEALGLAVARRPFIKGVYIVNTLRVLVNSDRILHRLIE